MLMSNRTVLYYPTIEIPTGPWLRQALLYWDHVASIVPRSYDDWRDAEAVARYGSDMQFLYNEGVFKPYNPDLLAYEDHRAHVRLLDELKEVINSPSFRRRVSRVPERVFDVEIYQQKVSQSVGELLERYRLAERRGNNDRLLYFERNAAMAFMALLAKYLAVASNDLTIPSTDQAVFEHLSFRAPGVGEKVPAISTMLSKILPIPAPDVPLSDILKFRNDHYNQLLDLRRELDSFEKILQGCEDKKQVVVEVTKFKERIAGELGKLQTELRRSRLPTILSSLKALIQPNSPTLLGTSVVLAGKASSLTTIPAEWIFAGALGAGTIEVGLTLANKWEGRYRTIDAAPFSYLYYSRKRFGARSTA